MKQDPIEGTLDKYVASGKIKPAMRDSVKRLLSSQKKENLTQAVAKLYQTQFGEDEHYQQFVERAKQVGYWYVTEKNLQKASQDLPKILQEVGEEGGTDYTSVVESLHSLDDADLYAAFVLNIPQVREEVKKHIGTYDQLYRVSRRVLREKRKRSGKKRKFKDDKPDGQLEETTPYNICRDIADSLPDNHFDSLKNPKKKMSYEEQEEYEAKQRLFFILKEKARRDCFRKFNQSDDPQKALVSLESSVAEERNGNLRFLYDDQLTIFREYVKFQQKIVRKGYVNPKFENPSTQEKGVLPSFHQVVALYHNLNEKRFGTFDDCGTGKTAIASLMKPFIEEKKRRGKKTVYGRTLIIGPKSSSKAWKDGLEGDEKKRYFKRKKKVAWLNGEKNDEFMKELREAGFVFANFEQLILDYSTNGTTKKVYEVLAELGYDHVIVDEVQEAKNTNNTTKRGSVTESMAVRLLTNNPNVEYVSLLSGTPMPDNLNDYANILFILRPEYFLEEADKKGRRRLSFDNIESRFMEIYEGDPRALYALVRQNTIRRKSKEVTELPETDLIEDMVELTPLQRKIVDYVFNHGKKNWLTQIRYAVLDPRLVSPTILQELNLIGKVTRGDSAKYQRLEGLLTDDEGPIAKGEKIVIFSSMFAEGVTREAKGLEEDYSKLGLEDEFKKLRIRPLKEELEEVLSEHFSREIEFQSIDAFTSDDVRESSVDRLHDGLNGIIATTLSGGMSMNFSLANWCYFLDEHYSPATTEQGVAREARRGQKKRVNAYFLRGIDSIDLDVKALLEQKRENIQMALDGVELLDKEKEILLEGKDRERLKELFLRRRGGIGIDLSRYKVEDLDAFDTKKVNKRKEKRLGRLIVPEDIYEHTVAQEIREEIMRNPAGIWHDKDFVAKYCDNFESLSPYLLARAKVIDLVKRSKAGEISWPELLLADAAGQGILYSAFIDLAELVDNSGFELPVVVDRDFSKPMHKASLNPHKYLANMCGKPQVFDEKFFREMGKFDLIDNSSITLLPNRQRIRDYVLEANRILNEGGHLQLGVGGWYFSSDFFDGMKEAGFEAVVKSVRHNVSTGSVKQLKDRLGPHYAEAYRSKLDLTTFSIFQKVGNCWKVDDKYFLLENPAYSEEEQDAEEILAPKRRKGEKKGKEVDENEKKRMRKRFKSSLPIGTTFKGDGKRYTGKKRLMRDPQTGVVMEAKDGKASDF